MTRGRIFTFVFIVVVIIKVWLLYEYPIHANGDAREDAGLYVGYAKSIADGHWLGSYSHWTLAKGIAFSLWLVLLDASNIPYMIGIFLFHALGVYYLWRVLKEHFPVRWLLDVFTIVVLLNPYIEFVNHVIREGIYASLGIYIIASVIHILNQYKNGSPYWIHSIVGGLALGLFWNTREEGVWILPLFMAGAIYVAFLFKKNNDSFKSKMKALLPLLYIPLCTVLITYSIATVNYIYYDTFTTVDFKSDAYNSAYASLNRVKNVNKTCRRVPVNKDTRKLIYDVSPSFKKIANELETPNYAYQHSSCVQVPCSCGDFAGGWFMWAFRMAAAKNGYYTSVTISEDYLSAVSSEIDSACDAGLLDCYAKKRSLMPTLVKSDVIPILKSLIHGISTLRQGYPNLPISQHSLGAQGKLDMFKQMTNSTDEVINVMYEPSGRGSIFKLNVLVWIKAFFDFLIYEVMYYINIVALLFMVFVLVAYRQIRWSLFIYIGILGIILTRLLILSIIEVTSFAGITLGYICSLFSFVPILGMAATFFILDYSSAVSKYMKSRLTVPISVTLLIPLTAFLMQPYQNNNVWEVSDVSGIPIKTGSTEYYVDAVNGIMVHLVDQPIDIDIDNEHLIIEGWAGDVEAQKVPRNVYVEIDGDVVKGARKVVPRPDVTELYPNYVNSGFRIVIPAKSLEKGIHKIQILVLDHEGKELYAPAKEKEILIRFH